MGKLGKGMVKCPARGYGVLKKVCKSCGARLTCRENNRKK